MQGQNSQISFRVFARTDYNFIYPSLISGSESLMRAEMLAVVAAIEKSLALLRRHL
jgi:hypothetical protein